MGAGIYELSVVGNQEWDVDHDNIDVEVKFGDGRRFTATFFTVTNIQSILAKNARTGECRGGIYMWAREMVILKDLRLSTMHATVAGLLEDGEFEAAFTRVPDVPAAMQPPSL